MQNCKNCICTHLYWDYQNHLSVTKIWQNICFLPLSLLPSLQNGPHSLWAQATGSSWSQVACSFLPTLTTSSAKSASDSSARTLPTRSASTVTPMGEPGDLGRRCPAQIAWSVRWCQWMKRTGPMCCTVMLAALWATGCRPSVWMMERCFRRGSWCSGWWNLEMVVMVVLLDFLPHYIYVKVLTVTHTSLSTAPDTGHPAWPTPITLPLLPLALCHPLTVLLQISSPPPGWYTPTQPGPRHAGIWACSSAYFPVIQTAGAAPGWSTRAPVRTLTWLIWSCLPHLGRHLLWPSPACLSVEPKQPTMKSASASSPSTSLLIICLETCSG